MTETSQSLAASRLLGNATGTAGGLGEPVVADPLADHPVIPLPENQVSLVELLKGQLHRLWRKEKLLPEDDLCEAVYDNNLYLRRRAPYEMEEVLATLDQQALHLFQHSFGDNSMTLLQFAEAIINTGSYDSDRIHAFVGGVVDLYLEVRRSQGERAAEESPLELQWCQLMNHLIESPEIAMYEGNVAIGAGARERGASSSAPSCKRSKITDCANHPGGGIEKLYWNPYMGDLLTVEGTESMFFWTPEGKIDEYRTAVTPQLPPENYDEHGKALFTIFAVAYDTDAQELTALLSNRMIIVWRLRSREKAQWQQKRELQVHGAAVPAPPSYDGSRTDPIWKLHLKLVDWKDGKGNTTSRSQTTTAVGQASSQAVIAQDRAQEMKMVREKREERKAAEVATMLDIWWNSNMKMYVTTDRKGGLFFWDLRALEASILDGTFEPAYQLHDHKGRVTAHLELSRHKFTTCSLDHTVILWDNRNLASPELKIEEHSSAVLAQAYLPLYSSLVSVGCERRVFVWSIDSTAYRGVRAKLEAHRANLTQVGAGQKAFFTLDEAFCVIVWDGATLALLQSINCATQFPRHVCVLPTMGRVCIAGRRLNFYQGNEQMNHLVGMLPTKEQLARRKAEEMAAGSLKERAKPQWCGISSCRGSLLSVTEAEIKMHARDSGRSRVVFNAPSGESISAFIPIESLSLAVLGTNKGGVHFLKYRSGFALKVYPGRQVEEPVEKPKARKEGTAARSGGGSTGATGGAVTPAAGTADIMPEFGLRPRTGSAPSAPTSPASAVQDRGESRPRSRLPSTEGEVHAAGDARGSATTGGIASPTAAGVATVDGGAADATLTSSRAGGFGEDIQRGLTSKVLCLLACEERSRLYAGTAEGRVLCFVLDGKDFTPLRWANAAPDEACPVISLACTTSTKMLERSMDDEEQGLLVAGTQDGCAHVFGLINMRHAGSVNIPRILPDHDAPNGVPLTRIMLFEPRAAADLPCTMLTVDARSRMRLWGMRIHSYSGKLRELRLVVDGAVPLPLRLEPFEGIAMGVCTPKDLDGPEIVYLKTPEQIKAENEAEEEAKKKAKMEGIEWVPRKKDPGLPYQTRSTDLARLNCFTVVQGRLALPTFARFRWYEEAIRRPPPIPPEEPEEPEADDVGAGPFLTQPPGTGSPLPRTHLQDSAGKRRKDRAKDDEDSETDGEEPERVKERLDIRPRTPPLPRDGEEPPFTYEDGTNLVFIADSEGWIRCLDMAASVLKAVETEQPKPVRLEDPAQLGQVADKQRKTRTPFTRLAGSTSSLSGTSVSGTGYLDIGPLLAGQPVTPSREVWQVIGAWRASKEAVLSLVATNSPPGLVTMDANKEVKVWCTSGHLWAHLSTLPQDGIPPTVTLWPPPHTLAAQLALMEVAKGLADKLGLHTKRRRYKPAPLPTSPSSRLSPAGRQRSGNVASGSPGRNFARQSPSSTAVSHPDKPAWAAETAAFPDDMEASGVARPRAETTATLAPSTVEGPPADTGDADIDLDAFVAETQEADGDGTEGDVSASPAGQGADDSVERRLFTSAQMSEMIRNKAFSGGFRSYRAYCKIRDDKRRFRPPEKRAMPRGEPTTQEFQSRRHEFFDRQAEAFGLELSTKRDIEHWEHGVKGLGPRSSSEGALVRFADHAVNDVIHAVRKELGVDVSRTSRQEIRRPTFLANLDIGGVSRDPMNPVSATSQAVQKLTGHTPGSSLRRSSSAATLRASGGPGGDGDKNRTPLQSAGLLTVGRR